jgi:hypothetical protein
MVGNHGAYAGSGKHPQNRRMVGKYGRGISFGLIADIALILL